MNEKQASVDLIIPTYQPDEKFDQLMKRLQTQTRQPNQIYVINTLVQGKENVIEEKYGHFPNLVVINIEKEEFDHGGTRNYGASLSSAEFVLFMTQDAVPANDKLIDNMLKAFSKEEIAVVYGRQLAGENANVIETYTRVFNYPDKDEIKTKADIKRLGIKTYFCSNVCAMYRKKIYEELGGFVTKTIFNEDMIMASKVIGAGYSISYASKATVIHFHKYTYWQQTYQKF